MLAGMHGFVTITLLISLTLIPIAAGSQYPVGLFFSPIDSDSLTEGDYILAFRNYERASQLNVADADARIDLARLYVVTREYERAIIELDAARNLISDKKALSELEMVAAKLYLRLGVYDKSLEHLVRSGASDFLAGYCYEKLGDWESAYEYFSAAQHPGGELDDHVSYHRAYCLYELGRYEEALAAFESFKHEFPLSIYFSFAEDIVPVCYEGMKKYRKAIHLRNEMRRRNRGLEPAMGYFVGRDYEALSDKVKAREQYMKVITKYPRSRYALLSLNALKGIAKIRGRTLYHAGRISYHQREYQQAEKYLSSYTRSYPRGKYIKDARYLLGRCYLRLRMYSAAEVSFLRLMRSVASEKERARYLFNLARAQDRLGKDEMAAGSFSKVARIRVSSLRDDAIYRKGLIQEESDSLEQAIKTYMQVNHGDYADNALYRAGMAAFALGKADLAKEALYRLVYLYSDSGFRTAGRYWLARAFEQLDSLEVAIGLWRSVAKSSPFSYYGYLSRESLKEHGPESLEPFIIISRTEDWISSWADEWSPPSHYEKRRLERGLRLLDAGLDDEGVSELGRIDTANPLNAYLVARAYAASGLDHKAISLAEKIMRMASDYGVAGVPNELVRIAYPLSFLPTALDASDLEGIDPFVILAIMREESSFLPDAVSQAGAMGLMQIMPHTGKEMARKTGRKDFLVEDLFKPATSISFGTRYVVRQRKKFGELELAIAAYNAGPEVVKEWAERRESTQVDEFIELISYPETRIYVKNVLASWWTYQKIWGATSSSGS